MPGPWRRSSEWAEVAATRERMAKAAARAGVRGAWPGAEFCTAFAERGFVECCFPGCWGERGPVDLGKVLSVVELEVAGELEAGHARFAF